MALVKAAYKDLFDTRGDDAWTLGKDELIGYFRATDKTSEVIGSRQAGAFQAFAALAGHEPTATKAKGKVNSATKAKEKASRSSKPAREAPTLSKTSVRSADPATLGSVKYRDMAMTVRIEINLPTDGTRETYDNIFQSIRANLIGE